MTPDGVDSVIVNGQVVIDHGKHTDARPGKLLYGPGYTEQQLRNDVFAKVPSPSIKPV